MRGRAFLLFGSLCGCGVLSGLDGLEVVSDASASDATTADVIDASTLDGPDTDVFDASTQLLDGSGIHCGSTLVCQAGQVCCVTGNAQPYAYSCGANVCAGGGASLRCDDPSDCTTGQICCFTNSVAQCTSSTTTCANTLCANAQQCGAGNNKCSPFGAGFGLSLSRCQ